MLSGELWEHGVHVLAEERKFLSLFQRIQTPSFTSSWRSPAPLTAVRSPLQKASKRSLNVPVCSLHSPSFLVPPFLSSAPHHPSIPPSCLSYQKTRDFRPATEIRVVPATGALRLFSSTPFTPTPCTCPGITYDTRGCWDVGLPTCMILIPIGGETAGKTVSAPHCCGFPVRAPNSCAKAELV